LEELYKQSRAGDDGGLAFADMCKRILFLLEKENKKKKKKHEKEKEKEKRKKIIQKVKEWLDIIIARGSMIERFPKRLLA
jgi:hypothetical protein